MMRRGIVVLSAGIAAAFVGHARSGTSCKYCGEWTAQVCQGAPSRFRCEPQHGPALIALALWNLLSRSLRALGRRQGRKFCVIAEHAAVSSGRKLEWYGPGRQILFLIMVTFFPVFVRYRRLCGFWYERPKS